MALTRLRDDELAYTWMDDGAGAPLQMALLAVFDAGPFRRPDGGVDTARVSAELARRARRVPALGRRVVWTRPGEGRPVWVADPAAEPLAHVAVVPLPAGADLGSWAATRAVRPLDRERPLWRAEVVGDLPGGGFAVQLVLSHVLADGRAAVALAGALLDDGPSPGPRPEPVGAAVPLPLPSHRALLADHLQAVRGSRPHRPRGRPSPAKPDLRALGDVLGGFAGREPRTSLSRPSGAERRLVRVGVPLGEVRECGHALGATVDDLVLAAVTEGLRRLLTARGECPPGLRLRCSVPAATGPPGRQVMRMLLVPLPVGEPDPLRRLTLVRAVTAEGKRRLRASGQDVSDLHLPDPLARWLLRTSRRLGSRRLTLSVTDVPGPAAPLWLAGARMVTAVPIAPLSHPVPVSGAALSYAGELTVAVVADGQVADLDVLGAGLADGFARLPALARRDVPCGP